MDDQGLNCISIHIVLNESNSLLENFHDLGWEDTISEWGYIGVYITLLHHQWNILLTGGDVIISSWYIEVYEGSINFL